MSTLSMQKKTFNKLREIVYDASGISLGPKKEALVCARVGKRMRVLGLKHYEEYLEYLEDNQGELVGLLDSVSTNVTSFFREEHHFDMIADKLEEWYSQGQRRFRLWSAACSTGEEPYSLAMVIREALPFPDVDARILATDISTEALQRCNLATYDNDRLGPVPADLRHRWFDEQRDGRWAVKRTLRDMVVFRRMNLSQPPFPMSGPLDAIFCRNVMIYFDDSVRMGLLDQAHRLLKPEGLLFVGHAESLAGMISDFKYVKPSVYRRA
jgi:chemotaxis protein methyltransferase CheR